MLVVDIESRSLAPIEKVGAWAYSRDHSTEVMCLCALDINTQDSITIDFVDGITEEQIDFLNSYDCMIAHNYTFEEAIFLNQLWKYGIKPPKGWLDTMDICAYLGAPMKLEKACEFLFNDDEAVRKDSEGKKIMHKICRPFKGAFRKYTDEDFVALKDYCMTDVEVTSEIFIEGKKYITAEEWMVMKETHEMNHRGIPLDRALIYKLNEVYEEAKAEIDLSRLGLQTSDLNRNAFMQDWLMSTFLVEVPNMQAATIEELLSSEIHPDMREVLEARQVMGASSIKKLDKALAFSDGESVVRNCFQYHGAKTGRFAGRGVQPQNMPRGFKKDEDILGAIKELGL